MSRLCGCCCWALTGWLERRERDAIAYLIEENRLLRRQLGEAMIPACFAVDLKPDVLIRETWDSRLGYIRFIEKNLWDFVPDLYEAVTGKEMPS